MLRKATQMFWECTLIKVLGESLVIFSAVPLTSCSHELVQFRSSSLCRQLSDRLKSVLKCYEALLLTSRLPSAGVHLLVVIPPPLQNSSNPTALRLSFPKSLSNIIVNKSCDSCQALLRQCTLEGHKLQLLLQPLLLRKILRQKSLLPARVS
eukprot:2636136-Amphidinium_carterae.1